MTKKHTPAPWMITNCDNLPRIIDVDGKPICLHARRNVKGEALANARLIAAAPDLLESLKALRLQLWEKEGCAGRKSDKASLAVIAQVDVAIAKAEGK